jgi:hypothetical protein
MNKKLKLVVINVYIFPTSLKRHLEPSKLTYLIDVDVETIIGLTCMMSMLEFINSFFFVKEGDFICDFL